MLIVAKSCFFNIYVRIFMNVLKNLIKLHRSDFLNPKILESKFYIVLMHSTRHYLSFHRKRRI
ncbi:hypothetical protein HFN_1556 [Helicobacter fennelliae MRY12-0050]|uniref:Uncharacterized protein n=1 Tax=Helicobacter fennelliae MRY12-0050 TaxID=1325130 RepID=T1DUW7_9HELI|nr:hypothetical protein HFN_1556 [Helicobacter fennelliae MRY12-0050]